MNFRLSLKEYCLLLISIAGIALSLRSLYIIYHKYFPILYWDEWSFPLELLNGESKTVSLSYLFRAHNEHIISTTKLLFILDYFLFHLTNGPLVAAVATCAAILSILLATLIYRDQRKDLEFLTLACVLTASGLSMVQWENLLWGFQPQFYLVLIGAVLSIASAVKLSETEKFSQQAFWFFILLLATAFCVFSMGNGVAIPISVVIYFILVRYKLRTSFLFAVIGVALIIPGLMASASAPKVGDPTLKTPLNMAAYFVAMIANPITRSAWSAIGFGILICIVLGVIFVKFVVIPWIRNRQVDRISAALFALCSFLLASAMATTYGRTSLGLGTALSSRYSTPMLFLTMTIFSILLRRFIIAPAGSGLKKAPATVLLLVFMLAVVAFTTFRRDVEKTYTAVSETTARAAYFVVSGVDDEVQLGHLYPDSKALRRALDFIRRNHLNVFAPHGDLSMPSAADIQAVINPPQAESCRRASVDFVTRLAENQWQVSGWATDDKGKTPRWIIATNSTGRLIGFTKPLERRPDVTKAVGAERDFKGFLLPIASREVLDGSIKLGVLSELEAPCLITIPRLPFGPYVTGPLALEVLQGDIATDGQTATPGQPSVLQVPPPYTNATTVGTWVSSDENMGAVRYSLKDIPCKDVFLPVMNGPSAQGVTLQIDYGGNQSLSDSIDLAPFVPHVWNFFRVPTTKACHNGFANLTLALVDKGQGWGAWAAMGLPGQAK
ncbi:hypothetical protein [Rhizobium binxianense]